MSRNDSVCQLCKNTLPPRRQFLGIPYYDDNSECIADLAKMRVPRHKVKWERDGSWYEATIGEFLLAVNVDNGLYYVKRKQIIKKWFGLKKEIKITYSETNFGYDEREAKRAAYDQYIAMIKKDIVKKCCANRI